MDYFQLMNNRNDFVCHYDCSDLNLVLFCLFDNCIFEMYRLMLDSFGRFKHTPQYAQCEKLFQIKNVNNESKTSLAVNNDNAGKLKLMPANSV